MKISIIVPVYNEERTISKILAKVKKAKLPKSCTKEIVVVDDGSTDETSSLLKKIKNIKVIRHNFNQGKGAAIKTALGKISGDIIIIQDADLEYNPNDYKRLIQPLLTQKTLVVYGTRLKNLPLKIYGGSRTPFPLHYLANKTLTLLTNIMYGCYLTDIETCYKVIHKEVIGNISLHSNRFEIEPEITVKIIKNGYTIYEVPIKVKPRGYKEGKKIKIIDGFLAFWIIMKYRFVN